MNFSARFWSTLFLGLSLLRAPPCGAAETKVTDRCFVPAELVENEARLPRFAQALAAKRPITIVAIGSASTAGLAAGDPRKTYPSRLEAMLRQRYPEAMLTVLNRGVPFQTARQMLARFKQDVLENRPDLVIWEVGTNDAVLAIDPEEFSSDVQAGIDQLQENHIEVILIDMQFARNTTSVIDFQPYGDALRNVATANDVFLFRRFDMMRYWSEEGAFPLDNAPKAELTGIAGQVYECIALRLSEAISYAGR